MLKSLKPDDWNKQTVSNNFTVKDIVANLLATSIKRLSIVRDGHSFLQDSQFSTEEKLLSFLNELNSDWTNAMKRVSTEVLIEMMEKYQDELLIYFKALNPFDIAREYMEAWLHQQQIRFAMNNQKLLSREFYHPFLQTVMQELPLTYEEIKAAVGSTVKVEIVGPAGGVWTIIKGKNSWNFLKEEIITPDSLVYIDQQIAWLLFSKGVDIMDAAQYYQLHGDRDLGSHALKMTLFNA
ncbi:MAG: hypothetical protein ABIP95_05205 [Pelobium sp.]